MSNKPWSSSPSMRRTASDSSSLYGRLSSNGLRNDHYARRTRLTRSTSSTRRHLQGNFLLTTRSATRTRLLETCFCDCDAQEEGTIGK